MKGKRHTVIARTLSESWALVTAAIRRGISRRRYHRVLCAVVVTVARSEDDGLSGSLGTWRERGNGEKVGYVGYTVKV